MSLALENSKAIPRPKLSDAAPTLSPKNAMLQDATPTMMFSKKRRSERNEMITL